MKVRTYKKVEVKKLPPGRAKGAEEETITAYPSSLGQHTVSAWLDENNTPHFGSGGTRTPPVRDIQVFRRQR